MNTPFINTKALPRLGLALALCGLWGAAHAALFEDDEARRAILDLRQRIEQSNNTVKALGEENAQLRRSLLDFQGQIDALKSEVSQSRGAQERLARDVSDVQLRQKDVQSGLDERLRKFEPVKVSVDGREFMAEPAEKRDFDAVMDIFRKGDFAASQSTLERFVNQYPQSGYLPSALFWLGNAQYANKAYKESMANFQKMLTQAPSHPRAPEAMLAISNVQIELKDLKGARKTLDELVKVYPATETAATARDRLARLR
ncbi:MAG: tol-pal system protein YbgF [Limnohabitans sp.]|nr:tol-pal system protein YbgF [Limnohabitans sp.]